MKKSGRKDTRKERRKLLEKRRNWEGIKEGRKYLRIIVMRIMKIE